jgi:uncharacterized membrane protein YfhO
VKYGPQSMELVVDARREALVATSIPGWRGWKATVDGRPAALIGYNHAFLAFRVTGGRHEVRLRYFPDAFRLGMIVSAGSLAATAVLLLRRRRDFVHNPP